VLCVEILEYHPHRSKLALTRYNVTARNQRSDTLLNNQRVIGFVYEIDDVGRAGFCSPEGPVDARSQYHWNLGEMRANPLRQLDAISRAQQTDVTEDDVNRDPGSEERFRFVNTGSLKHHESAFAQIVGQIETDENLVFDQQ
jgi:hypothetical protein